MQFNKLNAMLIIAGLGFSSGCASSGLKMPFRDSFASLGAKKTESTSAIPGGTKDDLSPEFRAAQKVFKKDPERTLLAWARWQEDVGEYGEARQKYRELLIAYPENVDAQLGLARIELACGRVQQAEDILLEVAKDQPRNPQVRLELGRLYTQQEEWPKAIAAFEDASAIDPENQVCRYELGVVFARVHRYDQALSHLTYAVGESAANYNIGYILHEQGNNVEAVEWFQNALQSHPDPRTAELTNSVLAKISPQNSRNLNSAPAYPSANPSDEFLARRGKQSAMDQFEPASFEAPDIRPAGTHDVPPNRPQSPVISNVAGTQNYNEPSTLLPPVNQQTAVYENANPTASQTLPPVTSSAAGPFRTVSHSTLQQANAQPTASGNKPPQWRGASHPPATVDLPAASDATPGKWRSR